MYNQSEDRTDLLAPFVELNKIKSAFMQALNASSKILDKDNSK